MQNPKELLGSYLFLGIQLALTVAVFVYIGYKADEYFGTAPWCLIGGGFLGAAGGMYNLFKWFKSGQKKQN